MRLAHRTFLTIGSHKAGTNFVFQGKKLLKIGDYRKNLLSLYSGRTNSFPKHARKRRNVMRIKYLET